MTERSLAKEIAVTAELTGTTMSEGAAEVMATELDAYDRRQVVGALRACRKELKGRLTMAAVLERLDDGRPGPEEAWSMIPMDEAGTTVWTSEMSQAFGVALALIEQGDKVAARMAFRETYNRMVQQARDQRRPVHWMVSLGHDPAGRPGPLARAVEAGRITYDEAQGHCPTLPAPSAAVVALVAGATKRISS